MAAQLAQRTEAQVERLLDLTFVDRITDTDIHRCSSTTSLSIIAFAACWLHLAEPAPVDSELSKNGAVSKRGHYFSGLRIE